MPGLLLVAIAPVFAIALYIYFRDKYEKEPWWLLLKAMVLGVFIAFPVIFVEKLIHTIGDGFEGLMAAFWNAFMVASLTEEAFKLAALALLIWKSREFNEKFDGIVYATFVSLGFAGIENVLYVTSSGGYATGLTRAFTAVPAHAVFGVCMGYYFGLAKFYPTKQTRYLRLSFFVPFILHGIYDFILMSGHSLILLAFVPFVAYMWYVGFLNMKQLNKTSYYRDDLDIGIDFSKVKEFPPRNESKF